MKKNRKKAYKKAQNIIKNNLPKRGLSRSRMTQTMAEKFLKGYNKIINGN